MRALARRGRICAATRARYSHRSATRAAARARPAECAKQYRWVADLAGFLGVAGLLGVARAGIVTGKAREFGDHPATAVARMRWARQVAGKAFGDLGPASACARKRRHPRIATPI